jgi:beta-glucosidase
VLAPAQQSRAETPAQAQGIEAQVETLLNQLTLEEKVNYLAGAPPADPTLPNSTSENVPPVPRLGLPELRNCDGPMGIRVNGGTSTRYPANLLLAATWDPGRSSNEGIGIGRNARARGFAIWYGPGADMYREGATPNTSAAKTLFWAAAWWWPRSAGRSPKRS